MSNPKYKVWNPLYILGVVESRDHHLGACADLGHWCTSNLKPGECLRILDGRIISVHLKDNEGQGHFRQRPRCRRRQGRRREIVIRGP